MSTTETCRTTSVASESISRASFGAQLPRLTIDESDAILAASGGDLATQAADAAADTRRNPLPGSSLPHPTNVDAIPRNPPSGGDTNSVADQTEGDAQIKAAGHGPSSTASHVPIGAQSCVADRGSTSALDQPTHGDQPASVEGGPNSQQARVVPVPTLPAPAGADAGQDRNASPSSRTMTIALFDPALAFAADILDDTEGLWVANSNRLRTLTTAADQADADGVCRGFGLTEAHPDVARLAAMVATLEQLTKDATKHLEKVMRRHPLHPWVKAQKGLGDKQTARLLAAIGDPYWNTLHDRPRTVSELWSYCGLGDAAAQVRRRGVKANWSADAKKRAWLIANSVVKAGGPYREIYDATKDHYADGVHAEECKRCGPSGKPAQPGSPLSKAHIHARGLRAISKAVLKDLWIEARRLHELPADDQGGVELQSVDVVGRGQT